jgi:hypothetical protein
MSPYPSAKGLKDPSDGAPISIATKVAKSSYICHSLCLKEQITLIKQGYLLLIT